MENDSINLPVQSLWIGSQLSNVERLCIQSFLDCGHAFHLYTYEKINNAPIGTTILDARSILPEEKIFRYKKGWAKDSVSGFADIFRLEMIKKNGGWWVDMDIICLKKLDFKDDLVFCSSFEPEYGSLVNNCIFKAPKDSFFLNYCLQEIEKLDVTTMDFGLAGPFLFQKAIKALKLEKMVRPYDEFNPISWKFIADVVLGKMPFKEKLKEIVRPVFKPQTMKGRVVSKNAYTLHLWNEVWKAGKLDKNASYAPSSKFELLKKLHNIG
ncbi:MAG: hypothetical protein EOO90_19345 [Pedobacter sp.]|nr:MAG: hypothetical protein EOO90_19345 [Pedobacter sp.]